MIPEVKKRVEDIKSGEVPEGYKRMKYVGICPKEWKVGKLEDVLYNEQRPVKKPTEPYWRLGVRSWAKGTFQSLVDDPSSVAMDELYKVRENDLIVNITFAWEHAIAIAKKEDDGMFVSHRFPTYVFKPGNVPDYYKAVISQPLFKKMLEYISPGGAGRNRVLNRNDFLKLPCYILPTEEQKRIADILSEHDKIINLCDKKLENLRLFKKACLQKMFPKKGSNVPEIRFPGFTAPWEQRKVSEITKFHKQGFYTTEEYNESKKYFLLRGTDLSENKLILKDTPKVDATEKDYQAFKTEIGDFLIVRSGTVGTYGIVYKDIPAIFGSYLIDFRFDMEQVTNEFFGYFYQSESFKSQLRQIVQQSANTNINAENIKSTSIMLPSIAEQKRIGDYLGQLDNLITLHQRKCDLEMEKKKALMQLLLTGIVRT